jgi:predicted SprT family Zn-dependent metalloprotease
MSCQCCVNVADLKDNPPPRRGRASTSLPRGFGRGRGPSKPRVVSGKPVTDHKRAITASLEAVRISCVKHYGAPDAAKVMKHLKAMPMTYNRRLVTTAGRFLMEYDRTGRVPPRAVGIELNGIAMPGMSDDLFMSTMIHEYIHAAEFVIHKVVRKDRYVGGHGAEWKSLMRGAGQPDNATYAWDSAKGQAMSKSFEGRGRRGSHERELPASISGKDKSQFRAGDRIKFQHKGKWVHGTVRTKGPKRAAIRVDDGGGYRVPYSLLFDAHPGAGKPFAEPPPTRTGVFPKTPPKPAPKPRAKPKPRPAPKPKAKPKAKPRAKPKPRPAPKPRAKPRAKPKTKAVSKAGFKLGQKVYFMVGKKKMRGVIEKLGSKTALVGLRDGEAWTVDLKELKK